MVSAEEIQNPKKILVDKILRLGYYMTYRAGRISIQASLISLPPLVQLQSPPLAPLGTWQYALRGVITTPGRVLHSGSRKVRPEFLKKSEP